MLDDPNTLRARDPKNILGQLAALPDSDATPDGALPGPYSAAFASWTAVVAPLLGPWFHGGGAAATHFNLGGVARDPTATGVMEVLIGDPEDEAVDVRIGDDPFAPYQLVRYLAFATGRADTLRRTVEACRVVASRVGPAIPTEANPAKRLAWTLWQRVPLLLTHPDLVPAQWLAQATFARLGKCLAVPSGPHPALLAASAFEARHALADDLVGLWLGAGGGDAPLINEVLGTRVAQIEPLDPAGDWLPPPSGEVVVDAMTLWYATSWVASYGALLGEHDPDDGRVYRAVRAHT
jgi:hypothetical protein